MTLAIGDLLDGKYQIVRLLGEGGMGAVYEGLNTRIHRKVAIKVLHTDVASSREAVGRFEREAQAAGRIGSEHIVEVLDLGIVDDSDHYMVMEYLEGESLGDRISRLGQIPPRDVAQTAVGMLQGLQAAHQAGIIHRDLKPDNIFLVTSQGRRDFVKIVDFGISKFNSLGGEFSMTQTGAVMGTPYYMSPEQAQGKRDIDHRSDVYSAGVILYQALVGQVPFDAATFNELLFKVVLEQPQPIQDRVPGIDIGLADIVHRAMARAPDERFQTAEQFRNALENWLAGKPVAGARTVGAGTPDVDARPSTTHVEEVSARREGSSAALGSAASGTGQSDTGAHAALGSTVDQLPVRRSPTPFIVGGVVALAVAGGLALALAGSGSADNAEETPEAAASAADPAANEADRPEPSNESDSQPGDQSKKSGQSESGVSPKPQVQPEPTPPPASQPPPAPRPASQPQPRPAPRPASQPQPRPAPVPQPQPSDGRSIRTEL